MDLLVFLTRPGHAVSVFLSELKRVMTNFTQRGSRVSTFLQEESDGGVALVFYLKMTPWIIPCSPNALFFFLGCLRIIFDKELELGER